MKKRILFVLFLLLVIVVIGCILFEDYHYRTLKDVLNSASNASCRSITNENGEVSICMSGAIDIEGIGMIFEAYNNFIIANPDYFKGTNKGIRLTYLINNHPQNGIVYACGWNTDNSWEIREVSLGNYIDGVPSLRGIGNNYSSIFYLTIRNLENYNSDDTKDFYYLNEMQCITFADCNCDIDTIEADLGNKLPDVKVLFNN